MPCKLPVPVSSQHHSASANERTACIGSRSEHSQCPMKYEASRINKAMPRTCHRNFRGFLSSSITSEQFTLGDSSGSQSRTCTPIPRVKLQWADKATTRQFAPTTADPRILATKPPRLFRKHRSIPSTNPVASCSVFVTELRLCKT